MRAIERVLVTGGAGFIGSALLRGLLARPGIHVLNYDAFTYAGLEASVAEPRQHDRYTEVRADVTDAVTLVSAIQQFEPDTVIHLAAESHVDRSIADPAAFVRTNVEGTATLLRAWRDYSESAPPERAAKALLVHVSTDEVYGPLPAGKAAAVGDPYRPSSPYAATKAAADHLVRSYQRTYEQRSAIVCPTNNYGPRQFPEKLIPLATLAALRGEPIPIYGDGRQVRDWLHVHDAAAGLIAVAERGAPCATYHLAGRVTDQPREWTNREVVEALCNAIDTLRPDTAPHGRLIQQVADRPGHDRRYALHAAATSTLLGWRPEKDLADGLRDTVRWYLENTEWVAAATAQG